MPSAVAEKRGDHCESCGEEIEDWRKEHTHLCSECGMPRCRGCGVSVEGMSNTMNGGLCVPCSVGEYGHPA